MNVIAKRFNKTKLNRKKLNIKYWKIIKKIQRNHVPLSSKALEKACGFSTETIKILVEAGCPLSSEALEIACGFSTEAIKILVEAGCPLSSKALEIACGFSTEAVKILVDAECKLSPRCLKIAKGFSREAVKILLNYKFNLIIKKILCSIKIIEYFVKNTKLDNDVIKIINKHYFNMKS